MRLSPVTTDALPDCERCSGTGFFPVETGYAKCPCQVEATIARRLKTSGIPYKLAKAEGKTFRPDPKFPSQAEAQRFVGHWVETFTPHCRGFILCGPTGTGKSHLAVAAFKKILQKRNPETNEPYDGECWNVLEFIESQKRAISASPEAKAAGEQALDEASYCDLLLLDDLGAERGTDYNLDRLHLIIDRRDRSELPLIVTTNLDPNTTNGLEGSFDPRTVSRLLGMCDVLVIDGEDYRRKGQAR